MYIQGVIQNGKPKILTKSGIYLLGKWRKVNINVYDEN